MMGAVSPRLPSLENRAATFAQGGASAHEPPCSVEAFALARRLGAGGFDCPVWSTADRRAVVAADGSFGPRLRRRPIRSRPRAELPPEVPDLETVAGHLGPNGSLLLDVADSDAFDATLAAVRAHDPTLEARLWLCSPSLDQLTAWRQRTTARLVHTARLGRQEGSPEQWVAQLTERAIDGLALVHTAWHGGLVALAHRFGRYALARGAEHERELATVFDLGIDGVSCRHVDRLMAVAALYYPEG